MKCMIKPVISGATGMVVFVKMKSSEAIPGKHSVDSLQATAILGTTHIIRKVQQFAIRNLSRGDLLWFKRRSIRKKSLLTRTTKH
jgi:hypothetical protein